MKKRDPINLYMCIIKEEGIEGLHVVFKREYVSVDDLHRNNIPP